MDVPDSNLAVARSVLSNLQLVDDYVREETRRQNMLHWLLRRQRMLTGRRQQESILRILMTYPSLLGNYLMQRVLDRDRQQPRTWCYSITKTERTHLVDLLVQPVFSAPNHIEILPRDILRREISARLEEDEVFETAGSRSEYYHRIAEKIQETEMELQEQWQTWTPPALLREQAWLYAGYVLEDRL